MEQTRSAFVDQVIGVLNRFDPMGLEPGQQGEFAAPWSEYEPEARDLAKLLHASGTVTPAEVDEVWTRWFGFPTGAAEELAADLCALVAA
jgi:hypothetical protein